MPRRLPHPRTALSGYVDQRLPGWQRALVARHLLGCTRCAVEVAQVRALREVLRRTPPPAPGPSEDLLRRLLALDPTAADPCAGPSPDDRPDPFVEAAPGRARHGEDDRPAVGAAGVLVVALVMVGTVGAGAAVTGVGPAWASTAARASVQQVLPRLWTGEPAPGGASEVRPGEDGTRP